MSIIWRGVTGGWAEGWVVGWVLGGRVGVGVEIRHTGLGGWGCD